MYNWKDTYRGVVHLGDTACGYEYTLCGLAFDEPMSEYGGEMMTHTELPCTCEDCKKVARELLPYLKREMRRIVRR